MKFETMQCSFHTHCPNAFDPYPEEDTFDAFDALDHSFVPFDMQEASVLDVQENAVRIQEADCKTWDAWDVSNSTFMESELSTSEPILEPNLEPILEPILEPAPVPDSLFYAWIHSTDDTSNHVQQAIRSLQWETVPGLETVPLMTVDQFQNTFILASGV